MTSPRTGRGADEGGTSTSHAGAIEGAEPPAGPRASLPHLVLSGFMASGKSTLGRLLAERAGVPFVDLDDTIVAAAASSHPTAAPALDSVAAIFEQLGEPAFRRLEAEALARALDAPPPTVIAVGGGALLDAGSRDRALAAARVVTLTASPAVLLERIDQLGQPGRPLLAAAPDRAARLHALLAERAPAYAEAHATVATDRSALAGALSLAPAPSLDTGPRAADTGLRSADGFELSFETGTDDLQAAANAVLRAWHPPSILVRLGARSYAARFTRGSDAGTIAADILATLRPSQWFLVTDTTVHTRWGARLLHAVEPHAGSPAALVCLAPGEREKHLGAVEQILHALVHAGADRDAVVVAHGGGVVSDIAGFAAAVLLRGVRWISLPTTLLSMADAAIGGKTGVDLGSAKNAAGAFHQPSAVVIDVRRTATESDRAFTSGLAEIVKCGAIADPELIALLEASTALARARDPAVLEAALARAVAVKAALVTLDERESGPRALLNFGHTLGHALEAAGDFERWTHGEAVALGMVAALRVGVALQITDPAAAERLLALLAALALPTHLTAEDVATALPFLSFDKKRRGSNVRLILVSTLGRALPRDLPLLDLAQLYRTAAPTQRA
jgi:shikimate kinase/3-dehydroquinate synthase